MTLTKSHIVGPTTPAVREMTFGDLLRKAAEAAPDRLALIAGVPDPKLRRQWTYAQFYREAQRTARALLSRFRPGERIAVWAQNLPEWLMLEFGAGMAGMVLVTVNPAFRAREVEYVLKQSRSAGVFVVNGFRGNPMLETVQAVAANCPELREIICFDDWNAFIAAGDDANIKLPAVSPDDPVMIQYTSGTTGFPKGALLRHRGLLNNGADTADRMGVDAGDVFVTTMPLFHTGGCVCCVIGAVSKAATQVLVEAFDPGLVLEMLGTYRGNAMLGVPTMLVAMLEHPSFATTDLSSVRAICSGGSTVPAALVQRLEKELGALKSKLAASQGDELVAQAVDVSGVQVLAATLEGADVKTLRETVDKLKDKLKSAAIVLASVDGGKVSLIAGVTPDASKKVKAGELVNFVAQQVGGKGGGRPDMAQGGGSEPQNLDAALARVFDLVRG